MINLLYRIFNKRANQYAAWLCYETGFSGVGPTELDKKPDFEKPWLPKILREDLERISKEFATIKKDAFRQACIEVLGEDPETDWT